MKKWIAGIFTVALFAASLMPSEASRVYYKSVFAACPNPNQIQISCERTFVPAICSATPCGDLPPY